jgi:predicted nuclease of predicted toxin-antitoxin system
MRLNMLRTGTWPRRRIRQFGIFALQAAAVIVTKDEDFAQRHVLTGGGPPVIWIRLPNTRRRELLSWFEAILPDILSALQVAKH